MTALTIEIVRGMLACNKHALDDELERQPEMMERITAACARAEAQAAELKDELARVEGRLTDDIKDGDAKLTKDQVDGRVRRHGERTRAFARHQEARLEHQLWAGLVESWKQKGYSLKTLAELYANQYYSRDSVSASPRRERAYGDARAAMREAQPEQRRASRRAVLE
jgi:hypothetical protein